MVQIADRDRVNCHKCCVRGGLPEGSVSRPATRVQQTGEVLPPPNAAARLCYPVDFSCKEI
jgi:hypothetical protein